MAKHAYSTKKPSLRSSIGVRRVMGPVAVGQKIAGLKKRMMQAQNLDGYWTVVNGKARFVRVAKPVRAEDRLARRKDRLKKRTLGR